MRDKLKAWSEGRGGHATADDLTSGLGDLSSSVDDMPVRDGVLLQSAQCLNCGWQMKHILLWREIAMFFCGRLMPGDQSAILTRQGAQVGLQCKHCGKVSPILASWADIGRWVDVGVREGMLKPTIYQARHRR